MNYRYIRYKYMTLNPGLTTDQVDKEDAQHIFEFIKLYKLEQERAELEANKKKNGKR